jgi:dsDNA-binding SOS-regulon protein
MEFENFNTLDITGGGKAKKQGHKKGARHSKGGPKTSGQKKAKTGIVNRFGNSDPSEPNPNNYQEANINNDQWENINYNEDNMENRAQEAVNLISSYENKVKGKSKGKEGKQNQSKKQKSWKISKPLLITDSLPGEAQQSRSTKKIEESIKKGIEEMKKEQNVEKFLNLKLQEKNSFGYSKYKNLSDELDKYNKKVKTLFKLEDIDLSVGDIVTIMESILKGVTGLENNIINKKEINGITDYKSYLDDFYNILLSKDSGIVKLVNVSLKGGVINDFYANNNENQENNQDNNINISKIEKSDIPKQIMNKISTITQKLTKYLDLFSKIKDYLEKREKENLNLNSIVKRLEEIISKLDSIAKYVNDNTKSFNKTLNLRNLQKQKQNQKPKNQKSPNKPSNKKPLQSAISQPTRSLTNTEKNERISEKFEIIVDGLRKKPAFKIPQIGKKLEVSFNALIKNPEIRKEAKTLDRFRLYKNLLEELVGKTEEYDESKNKKITNITEFLKNKRTNVKSDIENDENLLKMNTRPLEQKYISYINLLNIFIKFFAQLLPKNKEELVAKNTTQWVSGLSYNSKKTHELKHESKNTNKQLKYLTDAGLTPETLAEFISTYAELKNVNKIFTDNYTLLKDLKPDSQYKKTLLSFYSDSEKKFNFKDLDKKNYKKIVLILHPDKTSGHAKLTLLFKALETYHKISEANNKEEAEKDLIKYYLHLLSKKSNILKVKTTLAIEKGNTKTLAGLENKKKEINKMLQIAQEQKELITQSAGSHQLRAIQEKFSLFHANVSKYLQNKNGKAPTSAQVNREIAKRVKNL